MKNSLTTYICGFSLVEGKYEYQVQRRVTIGK